MTTSPGRFMLGCYDSYFGSLQQTSHRTVYMGFMIVMGGAMLAVLGWVLFFWSEAAGGPAWELRRAAIAGAGVGFPLVLAGMIRLLTADTQVERSTLTRISWATTAGVLVCLAAMAAFVFAYPEQWDVSGLDYSLPVVTVYGLSIGLLLLTTGSAVGCRCAVSMAD